MLSNPYSGLSKWGRPRYENHCRIQCFVAESSSSDWKVIPPVVKERREIYEIHKCRPWTLFQPYTYSYNSGKHPVDHSHSAAPPIHPPTCSCKPYAYKQWKAIKNFFSLAISALLFILHFNILIFPFNLHSIKVPSFRPPVICLYHPGPQYPTSKQVHMKKQPTRHNH